MPERTFYSSVSPKGQITLPAEIRKELGIEPKDQVTIALEDGTLRIRLVHSRLLRHYRKAGALKEPRSWKEIEEIAHDEHADHVAREGLVD
jgi:AbrB family looped-hinge helix DNA binding protein